MAVRINDDGTMERVPFVVSAEAYSDFVQAIEDAVEGRSQPNERMVAFMKRHKDRIQARRASLG